MTDIKIKRHSFIWNATYAGINALQSAIILFAVSRRLDISIAGILTIGFTFGNLAAIIARYGIRNFQVTDVREEYSFSDYLYCRVLTSTISIVLFALFLFVTILIGKYTTEKGLLIFEIIILKIIGAIEEVFVGRLQQQGRLDIGAMIASFRIGLSTIIVFVSVLFVKNIFICIACGIVVEVIFDLVLIPKTKRYLYCGQPKADMRRIVSLMKVGFPLCIGMALHNYIGNGPKYLVDVYLSDSMQAICGYIMMPMFVLTILNLFIMQPAVKEIGDVWNLKDITKLRQIIMRHISYIFLLSIAVMFIGYFMGLKILSQLYNVDLKNYGLAFLFLMLGGCSYTISAYFIVLLTAMRKHNIILLGCIVAIVEYCVAGGKMVQTHGFDGACFLYILANISMMIVFWIVLSRNVGRRQIV